MHGLLCYAISVRDRLNGRRTSAWKVDGAKMQFDRLPVPLLRRFKGRETFYSALFADNSWHSGNH